MKTSTKYFRQIIWVFLMAASNCLGNAVGSLSPDESVNRFRLLANSLKNDSEAISIEALIDEKYIELLQVIPSIGPDHNGFWYSLSLNGEKSDHVINLYFIYPSRNLPDKDVKAFLISGNRPNDLQIKRVVVISKIRSGGAVSVLDSSAN